jgi:hypothetical protein
MKALIALMTVFLFLTACSSTTNTQVQYQSQNNGAQYKGQNIAAIQKKWGMADQVMHTQTGTSFYVYTTNSGQNFFSSANNNLHTTVNREGIERGSYTGNMQLECTTVFKTDSTGMIIDSWHKGNNCGGTWVNRSKS